MTIVMSVCFVACGGSDNDTSTTKKRIKQIATDDYTTTFAYDTEGHIVKETIIRNEGTHDCDSTVYQYNDTNIVATRYHNGIVHSLSECTLTDNLITYIEDCRGEGWPMIEEYHFEYEGKNMVKRRVEGGKVFFTRNDDNITESLWTEPDSYNIVITQKFTYDNTVASSLVESWNVCEAFSFALFIQGYFGNGTKNRVTTKEEVYFGSPSTTTYTYETDSDGYPIVIATNSKVLVDDDDYTGVTDTRHIVLEAI